MKEHRPENSSVYKTLSRTAYYVVLLAWIMLGLNLLSLHEGLSEGFLQYFFSMEQSGIRFRALMLLAPFILTVLGYHINERARLCKKTLTAEFELLQKTAELEKMNELLTRENSERKKAEELLTHQAFYDALTGLPNRALFIDHLRTALERKKRYRDYPFAVLFLDVDRFKVINDSLGHIIGDHLLVMLAQRLKKHVRASDTIARFGGDEFAILLENTSESSPANDFAARLQGEMKEPFSVYGHEIFATISIGIVLGSGVDYGSADEVLRDADTAMYHAKACGKACHVIFDSTMHAKATMALQLETELRRAVEHKEFILFYQPIMSVENDTITGFEALLRWVHPEKGIILPGGFITVAEETGLILPLGEWVLREACGQLRRWQEKWSECRNMTVSVNVSAKVFSQPGFYDLVDSILGETGLPGDSLKLEIVERMLIEDPEPAAALIKRLRGLNVRFDIDDFGTGYSALNYLRHFPINGLKIDGSFISALTSDRNNAEIVKTIVALGHTLKLDVIAEGVETSEQLEIFRAMNGKYAQGFYLFRPMDSDAAAGLLSSGKIIP